MCMKFEEINDILKKQYNILQSKFGYEIFGIFLYGSQNYNLDTPESDIDTKVIIIPSFEDLVLNKPVSKTITLPWGECDIKDVREMIKSYKKQNVNYLETLFTDYYYINPKYKKPFNKLIQKREEIAHYNEHKAFDCFNGLMMQSKKRLTKSTETTKEDIEKYGYHRKSFMNIYKYAAMTEKYIKGADYKTVLQSKKYGVLRMKIYDKNKVLQLVKELDEKTKNLILNTVPKPINEKLSIWLDIWVVSLINSSINFYN